MYVMTGSGGGFGSRLVFELVGGAIRRRDVAALAEIDGLIDRAALAVGIEKAALDDFTYGWNRMVGRNGDIAGTHQFVAVEQAEGDAALSIAGGDDERRGYYELELQLAATRVGTARAEWCITNNKRRIKRFVTSYRSTSNFSEVERTTLDHLGAQALDLGNLFVSQTGVQAMPQNSIRNEAHVVAGSRHGHGAAHVELHIVLFDSDAAPVTKGKMMHAADAA